MCDIPGQYRSEVSANSACTFASGSEWSSSWVTTWPAESGAIPAWNPICIFVRGCDWPRKNHDLRLHNREHGQIELL